MRILFLSQIIPYPPDAGPKVKTWHVLRYLVEQGHQVILASFVRPEEEQFVPVVEKTCSHVYSIPIRRSRIADIGYWLRSIIKGRPFLVERDDIKEMRALVNQIIAIEQIDVIHADQITMAQFAIPPKNSKSQPWPTTIFDAHNAVWTIVNRLRENAPWFLKPVLSLETHRIQQFEGEIVQSFDHTLTVTKEDQQALVQIIQSAEDKQLVENHISVIPIAVDTQQLQPATRKPNSMNILTMGTLHYPPNADGIRWFARDVFPLVKDKLPLASLTIIGKNPPADFIQLASEQPQSIKVTDYVPDLDPYMNETALMVVPVRAGGGMRVRILEGFARAIPMVTTTVGLEGIEAQHGTEVLVEDTEIGFSDAVIKLLSDPDLQNQLAKNGRRLAEQQYDWQAVLNKLGTLYADIQTKRTA